MPKKSKNLLSNLSRINAEPIGLENAQDVEQGGNMIIKGEFAFIEILLQRWGRWALRVELGGLGYPSKTIFDGGDTHSNEDGFSSAEPKHVADPDIFAADRAVSSLQTTYRIVIIQVHKIGQGKSDSFNATALSIDRKTMHKYLNEAHRQVARLISV